jgi:hypothetical protein
MYKGIRNNAEGRIKGMTASDVPCLPDVQYTYVVDLGWLENGNGVPFKLFLGYVTEAPSESLDYD